MRRLLERCLEKDPKRRLRDIGDMELLLAEAEPTAATAPVPERTPSRFGKLPGESVEAAGAGGGTFLAAGVARDGNDQINGSKKGVWIYNRYRPGRQEGSPGLVAERRT